MRCSLPPPRRNEPGRLQSRHPGLQPPPLLSMWHLRLQLPWMLLRPLEFPLREASAHPSLGTRQILQEAPAHSALGCRLVLRLEAPAHSALGTQLSLLWGGPAHQELST